jgi:hypothetical protein
MGSGILMVCEGFAADFSGYAVLEVPFSRDHRTPD